MMNIKSIKSLAALLIVGCTFVSCSSNDTDDILNGNGNPTGVKTYTLTVKASKGNDAITRAISLSGSTLSATWSVGDEVKVYNGGIEIGTLTAQNSGASTTLKGSLTSAPNVNDELTLKFLSPDYSSQEGTLEYIAANCDYAVATVTVNTVNTTENTITTTGNADFQNQQAIVKFTLTDNSASPSSINASKLVVTANRLPYTITITPPIATSVLYVAIPGISEKNIYLFAYINDDVYTYSRSSITFENRKYYTVTVKMKQAIPPSDLEVVDLGLPSGTLWANMNVGATTPEEYGNYYAWGETLPQNSSQYSWTSYKYCYGDMNSLTKYSNGLNNWGNNNFHDEKTVLDAEDDAATTNWGSDWCMPTIEQYRELNNNTTSVWTTQGDISGRMFTSKTNGKSIFFPSNGFLMDGSHNDDLDCCFYWSSTNSGNDNIPSYCAQSFQTGTVYTYVGTGYQRAFGFFVRPVRKN